MDQKETPIKALTLSSDNSKDFLQFITEKGWKYLSPCGCRTQMDKYVNEVNKYKNHEIWLNKDKTIFEIRIKSDGFSRKISTASAYYYFQVYDNYFPE
jgi:hypothetical protein